MKKLEFFQYGETETTYLKQHDATLGAAIDQIGPIQRSVNPDLFTALVNSIVSQQISSKALATVWARFTERLGEITPEAIVACSEEQLQSCGITFRKARYIRHAAERVLSGELDLAALAQMPDDIVCSQLISLEGVGIWTAEMLLIFSLQRPDVLSFGDLAILRGMRMLYHHDSITPALFEKYKQRYSPYATVASLYLWAISAGAIPGLYDPAFKKKSNNPPKEAISS